MLLRHHYVPVTHGIHTVCYGWLSKSKSFICRDMDFEFNNGMRPTLIMEREPSKDLASTNFFALCKSRENVERVCESAEIPLPHR